MNPYEQHAREAKVARLVEAAMSARNGDGFTDDELIAFTSEQWQLLADAAGVRPASEVTKAMTVSGVRAARAERSSAADPFVGI